MEKVIIIGSGPAAMTAAIYTGRAELKPLVIAGVQWGGLLMWTTCVENYPGFPDGVMGPELMMRCKQQAEKFGARFILDNVAEVDFKSSPFKVKVGDKWEEAESIIIGAGTKPRTLRLPREKEFIGRGLSVCATCDGALFKEKDVIVVGGGDSAMEEANFLSKFAKSVTVLVRSDKVRASKIMLERSEANQKIKIMYNTEVIEYLGDKNLAGVKIINNKTQEQSELTASGLFLAIGHIPTTEMFQGQLPMDELGYLKKEKNNMSSIEGVFICGDIEDGRYRQAVVAAGDGCKAALDTIRWLEKN